jgi:hypothetical protein
MSLETYKLIHLIGVVVLFLGLGGTLAYAGREQKVSKVYPMLHGLGLLAVLVSGFGSLAKQPGGMALPTYAIGLLGTWLLLGALPVLVRRGIVPAPIAWLVAAGLGALAVWLGTAKPI